MAGRARPGFDGIWTGPGFGRSGDCFDDASLGERDQQRFQQRSEQPFDLVSWWLATSAFVLPLRVEQLELARGC